MPAPALALALTPALAPALALASAPALALAPAPVLAAALAWTLKVVKSRSSSLIAEEEELVLEDYWV